MASWTCSSRIVGALRGEKFGDLEIGVRCLEDELGSTVRICGSTEITGLLRSKHQSQAELSGLTEKAIHRATIPK
jgi:hypothetical protein